MFASTNTEIIWLIWLAGAVLSFIAFCIFNKERHEFDKEHPAAVISVSLLWPLMVIFTIALAPFLCMALVYMKFTGSEKSLPSKRT